MKYLKKIAIMLLLSSSASGFSQITEGFETAMLDTVKLLNGSDGGRFHYLNTGEMTFPVKWDTAFKYWASGWAMSKLVNNKVEPPNYSEHLYSAAPGNGVENGKTGKVFMVGQTGSFFYLQRRNTGDFPLRGFYVSNSTYAYNSMKFGDMFAKKFGGSTGNDEDSFILIVRCFKQSQLVEIQRVVLADFRFADASKDYILNDWKFVTIKDEYTDSIVFELVSSDVGAFGMNTPAFFVLDGVEFKGFNKVENNLSSCRVFPVPANDILTVSAKAQLVSASILDYSGRIHNQAALSGFDAQLSVENLPQGSYILQVNTQSGSYNQTIQVVK